MKVKLWILGLSVSALVAYFIHEYQQAQNILVGKKKCPCEEQNNHTDLESLELFKAMTTGE